MKVLLDNNVNHRFARLIIGHEVIHSRSLGLGELYNGDLIAAAEEKQFDVMVTADKQMEYQQNLVGRRLSIVVLNSLLIRWMDIAPLSPKVQAALDSGIPAGTFIRIGPEVRE
jgi:predicted nuclease of predicted toxin-antitoxin system